MNDLIEAKKPKWKLSQTGIALFLKEIFANPSAVGAACPSSKKLARAIAAQIPLQHLSAEDLIVELGAGTGVITTALLERGVPDAQMRVVERSPALAAYLRGRFPQLKILLADACHLSEVLSSDRGKVKVIVSSLPLVSLPPEVVKAIGQQLRSVLPSGGLFIQYTYSPGKKFLRYFPDFNLLHSKLVVFNFPPAWVEILQKP